jgi:hypothetical protein
MTAPDREPGIAWFAVPLRGVVRVAARVLVAAVLIGGAGCKSKDGGGIGKGSDPLFGNRIPKQNIPLPDRGGTAGVKGRGDPLLGSPTGGTRANSGGYTDDPERFRKGPYIPGPGGSPAALAGRTRDDGDGLKIESPGGVPLTPSGGVLTGIAPDATAAAVNDPALGELAQVGVKRGDASIERVGGQVVVRVKVPTAAGPVRGYTGQAATEAAAVKQVVDQIKADRK